MSSCCRGALHQYAMQHGYTGLVQWENPGARARPAYTCRSCCAIPADLVSE